MPAVHRSEWGVGFEDRAPFVNEGVLDNAEAEEREEAREAMGLDLFAASLDFDDDFPDEHARHVAWSEANCPDDLDPGPFPTDPAEALADRVVAVLREAGFDASQEREECEYEVRVKCGPRCGAVAIVGGYGASDAFRCVEHDAAGPTACERALERLNAIGAWKWAVGS